MASALHRTSDVIVDTARQQILRFASVMAVVNLLLPVGLFVYTEITGQRYWQPYRGEDNLATWFSTVQLLLIGGVAYVNYRTVGLTQRLDLGGTPRRPWIWLVFALGFVFLALDERFDVHEALRENVFRPAGLFVDLRYVSAGDIGLYLYFLIGLMVTPFLLPELRRRPVSLLLFSAALLLTLATVIMDSLKGSTLREWPIRHFWDYVFEEVAEIWAQLLFLLSFLVVLYARLVEMKGRRGSGGSG